ncbi:MAG: hypothetical protein LBU85_00580 [Treponema sp.]|nr:hypothetical protein [Treponema sp.]
MEVILKKRELSKPCIKDKEGNTGAKSKKEIDEKGYTIPEYHFYIRYFGYKSDTSPVLKLKQNFIEKAINNNGVAIINTDYILICPDGQELKGKTDSKGFIRQNDVFIGNYKIVIAMQVV